MVSHVGITSRRCLTHLVTMICLQPGQVFHVLYFVHTYFYTYHYVNDFLVKAILIFHHYFLHDDLDHLVQCSAKVENLWSYLYHWKSSKFVWLNYVLHFLTPRRSMSMYISIMSCEKWRQEVLVYGSKSCSALS